VQFTKLGSLDYAHSLSFAQKRAKLKSIGHLEGYSILIGLCFFHSLAKLKLLAIFILLHTTYKICVYITTTFCFTSWLENNQMNEFCDITMSEREREREYSIEYQ